MAKTARMDIRIPSDLKDQLGAYAASRDRSKAYVIIEAIRAYLASIPKPN